MKKTIIILLLFSLSVFSYSQADTVKIGAYINSLYDLKLSEDSFVVDFWLWFHYQNDSLDPLNTAEIINAKEVRRSLNDIEIVDDIIWATQKYKATIKTNWNVKNFPFDKQFMRIEIEESICDTSELVFVADKLNTSYDSNISISGWQIVDFSIIPGNKTYNTTYGDPFLTDKSTYSNTAIIFVIQRNGWSLFIKLFTGVYVAFLISLMVFFIDPIDVDPRFGLSVGALFAAVGNKYVVDSILPETTVFTLVDKIHDITFIYLLLSIIFSVYSLFLYKKGETKRSKKVDLFAFFTLLITFIIINFVLIYNASS